MINQDFIEEKISEILKVGMGLNLNDPNLKETPYRVAKAFKEIFSGYDDDLTKYLKTFPAPQQTEDNQMIIIKDMLCYSMCEHHILPFSCYVSVGYIPNKEIIGISKVERIVKSICRKLQTQEYITEEVAEFLNKTLKPKGVIVVIRNSEHMCMKMRGIETKNATVTSSAIRGVFKNLEVREEFMKLLND